MTDRAESDSARGMFWAKLGGGLAIFAAVFGVATFVIPVGSAVERLSLAALVVMASSLLYQGIVATLKGHLDWRVSLLVVLTFGLGVSHAAIVVHDRDLQIDALRQERALHAEAGADPNQTKPTPVSTSAGASTSAPIDPQVDDLPTFDPFDAEPHANGTIDVALDVGYIGLDRWAPTGSANADVELNMEGITGTNGTGLTLIADDAAKTFTTCRDQANWRTAVNWNQLSRGSFLCVKLPEGRRAMLRIDVYPNFNLSSPRAQITGITWADIVDRP